VKKSKSPNTLAVTRHEGESDGAALARVLLEPATRHGYVAGDFSSKLLDPAIMAPQGADFVEALLATTEQAQAGDLSFASRMLAGQAVMLDAMCSDFARRAAANAANFPDASERFARMAFKAAGGSRAALEALARLHQPREQIVRHIYVNAGQAIVTDQLNHYAGGGENADPVNQSHATGPAGQCASMPCPDPAGDPMPVPSGEGPVEMPDARRQKPRRA
jgi:hypothetical protein